VRMTEERTPVRLLVCGDRNWTNVMAIHRELFVLPRDTVIIHGAARGADSIAGAIALDLGMQVEEYPADWETLGKAAGVLRNQQMLDQGKPDRVYAFHSNLSESRGTADMVSRARSAGIPTTVLIK
jgi:hypothetical protein